MKQPLLERTLLKAIPQIKIGILTSYHIVIDDSPQMLRGRFQFFQEALQLELAEKPYDTFQKIENWRSMLKALQLSPKENLPSSELLLQQIQAGRKLESIHSASDINRFLSLQYQIPIELYDLDLLHGDITIRLGLEEDTIIHENNQILEVKNLLLSSDSKGPFGSPIFRYNRAEVTKATTNTLQIFYLNPELTLDESHQLLQAADRMFHQVHGGQSKIHLLHD
ncbi:hypothetical protein BTS2_3849 [Bacillus sp. TS-2]|nr:hypothetical protein BTS2_3849 [Bacillus sp. TS-2]